MNSKITGITIVKLSTAAKSDLMYEQQCTGAATVSYRTFRSRGSCDIEQPRVMFWVTQLEWMEAGHEGRESESGHLLFILRFMVSVRQ